MELTYFLVFLLCFLPTLPAQQNQQIYDILFMVLQNPSTLKGKAPWGIHGIWAEKLDPLVGPSPQRYKYVPVQSCQSFPPFDPKISQKITKALDKAWSSLSATWPNVKFWEHEYNKHGSCIVDLLPTSTDYLMKALYLWEQLKFDEVMGKGKQFEPNTLYKTEDILKGIKVSHNVRPELTCIGNKLTDVRFCHTRNWVLVDCEGIQTSCTGQIKYVRQV
ncbi:putative ribonuclease T(2) [Rosa chinensis]|uniref:Putative ribonuclease T(2) n=1 Tax=Rosa chinensis TaxID=74649 RepID=A0A2P6RDI9_ROSCH|nr:putative ribonuclease T(2) [Rosa chinensis]